MKRLFLIFASAGMLSVSCGPKYMAPEMTEGSAVDFSLHFTSKVFENTDEDENVCVSPYSAGVALSMLAEGAENQTREEFLTTLNGCIFGKTDLYGNDTVVVKVANSLWIDDDFAIRNSYVNLLQKDFGAFATSLSFAEPSTVRAINNWCSENTGGKINDVVEELDPSNPLVLADAVYFKAPWDAPFASSETAKSSFQGSEEESQVDFMSRTGVYGYASWQGNTVVRIPYQGGRYAMTLIMPDKSVKMSELQPLMNETALSQLSSYMKDTRIRLSIPKFRIEYKVNLNDVLKSMGLETAFTSAADFKAIALGPLSLSSVMQKTYIDVSEGGSEAAAVTVAFMTLTAAPVRPLEKVVFDRPFCFMISDIVDGTILFTGRVMNL